LASMLSMAYSRAFTLIEVLIITGTIAIIAAAGFLSLSNFRNNQDLRLAARGISLALRSAQSRSISQENGNFWGVRFSQPSKEIILFENSSSCAYGSNISSQVLKSQLEFRVPASGNLDVCFEKISGYSSAASDVTITIGVIGDVNAKKDITIYKNGRIE
jgi:type II secretory pathway pseudopilin PulG